MLEKIKKITNPLTIIATFAGLAEISGTLVLPFLESNNQSSYVWFLMAFPTLLILLFFATLNYNHKVLYAPSDFKDEDNFLKLFERPTAEERLLKLNLEIKDEEESSHETDSNKKQIDLKYRDVFRRNTATTHYLAEELVITKLSQEFDEVDREVMLRGNNSQFLFDAIAKRKGKVFAIEVKYLKGLQPLKNIRSSLTKIQRTFAQLDTGSAEPMTVILAIATDATGIELEELTVNIKEASSLAQFPCEVRIFNLELLEEELLWSQPNN